MDTVNGAEAVEVADAVVFASEGLEDSNDGGSVVVGDDRVRGVDPDDASATSFVYN